MFTAAPEDLTTSMLSDREAHRRLEWDIRNGVILRKAADHGLATRSARWWCRCSLRQATDPGRRRALLCMAMHLCERVGLDFIDHAPFRFVSTVDLRITPEQVFAVLDDAESWPQWASVITKVTWTSPQPHGVGTTRTVDMRGGIVGDEEFLAWEPFSHMAFRFNQASTRSIAAFAEDYRIAPTPSGCNLTWVMAMKPNGVAARLGMSLGRPVMARMFQRFLYNLRSYADKRYAAA